MCPVGTKRHGGIYVRCSDDLYHLTRFDVPETNHAVEGLGNFARWTGNARLSYPLPVQFFHVLDGRFEQVNRLAQRLRIEGQFYPGGCI